MADFHQNGIITTLHNLTKRHLADLENDLIEFSKQRPMGLLLPSLFSELEGEALPNIIQQLKSVPYLSEIVIGLDRGWNGQRVGCACHRSALRRQRSERTRRARSCGRQVVR